MKTIIQKPWEAAGIVLVTLIFSVPLFAVVAPEHVDQGTRNITTSSEDVRKTEKKLQKIITEINSEQARHQKKIQHIEKELEQTESSLRPQENKDHWVSPKIAMVLGQDSQ